MWGRVRTTHLTPAHHLGWACHGTLLLLHGNPLPQLGPRIVSVTALQLTREIMPLFSRPASVLCTCSSCPTAHHTPRPHPATAISLCTPSLQAGAYRRLSSITARLEGPDDAAALLAAVSPGTLPALRSLVLQARPGLRARLGRLQHTGLRRLALLGVEAEDGFEGLVQLAGGFARWDDGCAVHAVHAMRGPRHEMPF